MVHPKPTRPAHFPPMARAILQNKSEGSCSHAHNGNTANLLGSACSDDGGGWVRDDGGRGESAVSGDWHSRSAGARSRNRDCGARRSDNGRHVGCKCHRGKDGEKSGSAHLD